MRCGDQFQHCMSGSSLFQGARQVPDGFWSQRAVHTGWGSSVALSCWFRTVAEARDENRDKRQGCGTACVPPVKSNRNVGKATWFSGSSVRPFPGACLLVSWLCGRPWPLAFFSGSVCGSDPVVCSWPCCVVWFRPPGLFLSLFLKEVTTQGTDPRTNLQAGIPKYVRFTWTWERRLGFYSYIFPIVSSCVSFSALPPRAFDPQAGVCGRASTCRAGSPWRLLLFTFVVDVSCDADRCVRLGVQTVTASQVQYIVKLFANHQDSIRGCGCLPVPVSRSSGKRSCCVWADRGSREAHTTGVDSAARCNTD